MTTANSLLHLWLWPYNNVLHRSILVWKKSGLMRSNGIAFWMPFETIKCYHHWHWSLWGGAILPLKKLMCNLPASSRKIPTLNWSNRNVFTPICRVFGLLEGKSCLSWNTTTMRNSFHLYSGWRQLICVLHSWRKLWVMVYRANHLFSTHFWNRTWTWCGGNNWRACARWEVFNRTRKAVLTNRGLVK